MSLLNAIVKTSIVAGAAAVVGVCYLVSNVFSTTQTPDWKIEFRNKVNEINRLSDDEKRLRSLHVLMEKTFKKLYPEYIRPSGTQKVTLGTMLKEKGKLHFTRKDEKNAIHFALQLRNRWTHEDTQIDLKEIKKAADIYQRAILMLIS